MEESEHDAICEICSFTLKLEDVAPACEECGLDGCCEACMIEHVCQEAG